MPGTQKQGLLRPEKTLQPCCHAKWTLRSYFPCFSMIAACAAARRAIGTRNGEQDT